MFCVFYNEHVLVVRVFCIEHKSAAKVQRNFDICKKKVKKEKKKLQKSDEILVYSKYLL